MPGRLRTTVNPTIGRGGRTAPTAATARPRQPFVPRRGRSRTRRPRMRGSAQRPGPGAHRSTHATHAATRERQHQHGDEQVLVQCGAEVAMGQGVHRAQATAARAVQAGDLLEPARGKWPGWFGRSHEHSKTSRIRPPGRRPPRPSRSRRSVTVTEPVRGAAVFRHTRASGGRFAGAVLPSRWPAPRRPRATPPVRRAELDDDAIPPMSTTDHDGDVTATARLRRRAVVPSCGSSAREAQTRSGSPPAGSSGRVAGGRGPVA